MGFIYMSESCDIISTLGTSKIFFPVLLLATMMRTSTCIFVRLKVMQYGTSLSWKKTKFL